MTSPVERVRMLELQLEVQRRATSIYQATFKRACDNLGMLGRGDVARSIAADAAKQVQAIPNYMKGTDDDDDDLAG